MPVSHKGRMVLAGAVCALALVAGRLAAQHHIRFADADYVLSSGDTVALPVVIESPCSVAGFSLGVTHDPAALVLEEVTLGAALAALFGEEAPDPDFFVVEREPAGGTGFLAALVLGGAADAPRRLEPPAPDLPGVHEVLLARYSAAPGARGGDTTVRTTANLRAPGDEGAPAVPLLLDTRPSAHQDCSSLPASERDQEVGPAAETIFVSFPFVRGTTDGEGQINISDAVRILRYLFQGGDVGECPATFNTNGSTGMGRPGREDLFDVELTDGIQVLNFLFRQGVAPAAPFPGCGPSPSPLEADMLCRGFADCS